MHIQKFALVKGVIVAAALSFSLVASAGNDLQIKTKQGKVEGKPGTDGKVRVFLGIPYAAPPVGEARWKVPQKAAKWHGIRPAISFGPRCMQAALYSDMVFRDAGPSEDCLTLNVWTPAKDKKAKLPVMVWIHGGGFTTGGTSEPRQDGEHLAHKDVIVVSMNYRLGIFGFFAHHELAAESKQHAAGNYGLLDQTAALGWVKQNIAAFGGDPANVTLFGESAGSFSVSAQLASPLAKGLIARAIGESGGAFGRGGLSFPQMEEAERQDEAFASQTFGKKDLAALRALPAERLLAAFAEGGHGAPRTVPDVDGYFFPESVSSIYAKGDQAHVPLLAGWNRDEGTSSVVQAATRPTAASFQAMASKEYGQQAPAFLKAYAVSSDDEALRVAEDYAGDQFIAFSTWEWMDAHEKTGGQPVFRYRFDRPSPGDPNHAVSSGAFHSDDIEYVFGNLDSRAGAKWLPEDYALSDQMQTYWTNCARTGNPNATGLPSWPAYDAAGGWQVLHLDAVSAAQPDRQRDRYLFLQGWSK